MMAPLTKIASVAAEAVSSVTAGSMPPWRNNAKAATAMGRMVASTWRIGRFLPGRISAAELSMAQNMQITA